MPQARTATNPSMRATFRSRGRRASSRHRTGRSLHATPTHPSGCRKLTLMPTVHRLVFPGSQLNSYLDPESGLVVQSLDIQTAYHLLETTPCLVHLLPQFRLEALNKFSSGTEKDLFLSGCSPNQEGSSGTRTGMALYRCVPLHRPG
jgi:hypothetical protein